MSMDRRSFLRTTTGAGALLGVQSKLPAASSLSSPNIVLICADDLGYGDLGSYGSRIPTPNLDQMAAEGIRLTQFYAASNICSPSRAALLTGRYSTRVGVPYVLSDPASTTGLSVSETTMAQTLKAAGYATMCVGKWHVGWTPQYLPTHRGFDGFFGIPYSSDMWPLPLMQNDQVIQDEVGPDTLTQLFTQQAVSYINSSSGSPFFLYLAYSSPHIPLTPSAAFRGASKQGAYADMVMEVDLSVGAVLQAIQNRGIDGNTLVMFSSDHGPWYQGTTGGLRGRKAETWDGGMRVPFIARFPGQIQSGTVSGGVAAALDILPTVARLAGAPGPPNPLDGVDIWPLLSGARQTVDRDAFLYFDGWNLQCARLGQWKLHVARNNTPAWAPAPVGGLMNLPLASPELYNLEADPGEASDCAADRPDIVSQIQQRINQLLPTFPVEVQSAWRSTMQLPVGYTPTGALPIKQGS
jgi:arylsulfatase A